MCRLLSVFLILAVQCALTADGKRNVLLIMSDDLNNDFATYGHPIVKSPNLDRLAARGVRFDRAYCQYPVCNPSRSSLMTSLYPDQTGVRTNNNNFRKQIPNVITLPQLFRKNGYHAARVGKIYHYGVPTQIGTPGEDDPASWDEVINPRGRDKDDEQLIYSIDEIGRSMGGTLSWLAADGEDAEQTDGIGAGAAIELLQNHRDKPFFIAVGFYRPHTPYVAPKKYFEMYPLETIQAPAGPPDDLVDIPPAAWMDRPHQLLLDDLRKRQAIQAYYASITFMDAQLGRVLDAVDRLGLWENTVVVFVSDHGYHLGEHKLWQKTTLFENSARVPLIIAAPGFDGSRGRPSDAVVEMVDLYPTLADLSGLTAPAHVQGSSLRPQLDNPETPSGRAALTTLNSNDRVHRPPLRPAVIGFSIRTDRYRYTEWGSGEYGVELYDHQEDPKEYVNLAIAPHMQTTVADMKKLLAKRVADSKRPMRGGQ